jgi:hypothetical protein
MTKLSGMMTVAVILGLCVGLSAETYGQEFGTLPDYVPLLPEVKQKALVVDPHKGFRVKELKPDVYMITEGAYESALVRTGP